MRRTEQLESVGSGDSRSSIQEGLNEIITAGTQQLQLGGHIKESDMKISPEVIGFYI